jgi:flagellar biosynthesis chaperone FliJ
MREKSRRIAELESDLCRLSSANAETLEAAQHYLDHLETEIERLKTSHALHTAELERQVWQERDTREQRVEILEGELERSRANHEAFRRHPLIRAAARATHAWEWIKGRIGRNGTP